MPKWATANMREGEAAVLCCNIHNDQCWHEGNDNNVQLPWELHGRRNVFHSCVMESCVCRRIPTICCPSGGGHATECKRPLTSRLGNLCANIALSQLLGPLSHELPRAQRCRKDANDPSRPTILLNVPLRGRMRQSCFDIWPNYATMTSACRAHAWDDDEPYA